MTTHKAGTCSDRAARPRNQQAPPSQLWNQHLEAIEAFEANQSGAWPDHIATPVAVHPLGRDVICFVKRSALHPVLL
jgi:hypothetical protein